MSLETEESFLKFLTENAVILNPGHHYLSGFPSYNASWVLENYNSILDNCLEITRKNGPRVFSTPLGSVFIGEIRQDEVVESGGLRYFYPEALTRLMNEKMFYLGTPYGIEQVIRSYTRSSVDELLAKRKEDAENRKEAQRLRLEEEEKFIREALIGLEPTKERKDLLKRVMQFDLYYDYSDDITVYRAGKLQREHINAELKRLGLPEDLLEKKIKFRN